MTAALVPARYAVQLSGPVDMDGWREAARRLVLNGIPPHDIDWQVDGVGDLLSADRPLPPLPQNASVLSVPRAFPERAATVACHSDHDRYAFLYRILWRLASEPKLLEIASDPDVVRLGRMEKSVRRDCHKMRAFVRFVQVGEGFDERFVAWFEPEHFIVERNAPFFVRRFTGMRWTILTPKGSADWDGENLSIGPAASRADAPGEDAQNELWRTYFASIFNPARLKVKAMQAEMPKKYWRNLPEASLIPDLIKGAEKSAREMIDRIPTTPAPHHAKVQERYWTKAEETAVADGEAATLAELGRQAEGCRRCPLWREATQTVFGEGPDDARIVFVGEQPGDQEDLAGKPFVGPAGRLFDQILEEAGVDRRITYVTNAVKHFKFEPRGKRRIHAKPNAGEVKACNWWLGNELRLIGPDVAVALGATAAQALLGRAVAVTKERGRTLEREDGLKVFVTVHPSYLLRLPDAATKTAERGRFLDDMRKVKGLMGA
ncbi:UdgX family uracil-DNA binding protein [Chelativorans sp. ZYF759]|uniref:UdgX family uracil-DNA binding protein n=1 Tax=Chelativorans sp. ZYF759 TaxID=2692213 RepID=UPI00145F311B|nr:UdgX family uracil-DNA binding protein [Chelativorans sp. ZYF759]NMG39223.1 UdgX family uracil-DNA binding protein [Chelativorans sp. ZYF759]